jgi:hypothetical protein
MSRQLLEQSQLDPDYDASVDEGGDIGEDLSNQRIDPDDN